MLEPKNNDELPPIPGQKQAGAAIENVIIDLVRSKRIRGVSTGDHATDEIGTMVVSELRAVAATLVP